MRIDIHVHTEFSHDSDARIIDILYYANLRKLDAIAITDHDTLKGSEKARSIRQSEDVEIIPGVEITIPIGRYGLHLIGLFIEDYQPSRNLQEAIENIKREDGIVILPHPYRIGTGLFYHLQEGLVTENDVKFVLNYSDYIEGLCHKTNDEILKQTLDFVRTNRKSIVASTDSHRPENVGLVWTEIDDIGKFREGTALSKVGALVKPGWDMGLESLGAYLIENEFSWGSNEKQSAFKRFITKAGNMIPNHKVRLTLKNKYRKALVMQRRALIERQVRSAKRICIYPNGNSLIIEGY